MDPVEEGLLFAIRDAPDDDHPRLVYADWLATREPLRSELIAMSVELARDPRRADLAARREELLARPDLSWWRGTVRGFLPGTAQTIDARGFLRDPDWIFRAAPATTTLGIGDTHACMTELVEVRQLTRYRALELYSTYGSGGPDLGAGDYRTLAACPHLADLQSLAVRTRLTDEGLSAILTSKLALRSLSLEYAGESIVAMKRPSAAMSRIEELTLRGLDDSCDWLLPALRRAWRDTLRVISLDACDLSAFGDTAIAALASRPRLEVLGLFGSELRPRALAPLRDARATLRELRLGGNEIGDAGIAAITDAGFERLTALDLRGCELDPDHVRYLFAHAPRSLVSLDLSSNQVGDALDALARSADPHRFEVLRLERCGLDQGSLVRFVTSPAADRLQVLDVRGHYFPGNTFTNAVKRSRHLGALRELHA